MIRLSLLPRTILDLLPFVFLLGIIPITYWFELMIVLPALYPFDKAPVAYCVLFAIAHYLLFNIVGNLVGVLVNDTSIRGREMPLLDSPEAAGYCDICKSVTPPRSYHCPNCKICILRRDHHCLFTACCVGHFNYRYFLLFLFYMFAATAFCLPFNFMFMWEHMSWENLVAVSRVLFPAVMIFYGWNFTVHQGHLVICWISIAAMFFIGAWFYFHFRLALSGKLVHEMRKSINLYDLGAKENLKEVLGERWYLVWISPFLSSPLTCDGIRFGKKKHFQ